MSFKLHSFTHNQDIVQIPSKVSIIVYNMYLEASEMCVSGVTTSLTVKKTFLNEYFNKVISIQRTIPTNKRTQYLNRV